MDQFPPTVNTKINISQTLQQAVWLHRQGKLNNAEKMYVNILGVCADHFDTTHLLGVLRFQQGRRTEALALISAALELNQHSALALSNLGMMLREVGRLEEALAAFHKALAIKPNLVEALINSGKLLRKLKRAEEALASFDKVLAIKPDSAEALYSRGVILLDLNRPEEALTNFDKALVIKPESVEALYSRGATLRDLNRPEDAFASFDKALTIKPDYVDAFVDRGIVSLLMGDFPSGWSGYERRFDQMSQPKRALIASYRFWKGEDIEDKRIVVYQEQGLGDVIQFSRYLPLLSSLGAHVTFLATSNLHRLFRFSYPEIQLADTLSSGDEFEFQSALLSLPALFNTTTESIPSVTPYLFTESAFVDKWRMRFKNQKEFKIGIAWQGNPANSVDSTRSIPLQYFKPLASISGVRLFSLQKGYGAEQIASLDTSFPIENLGTELDFGSDALVDTAAIMACLDLIVTPDTSFAHLAGALGRPVWLVLKYAPDWRWMLNRSDSPWYPTMTLYRQTKRGDWAEVFGRVARDLKNVISASN